MSGSPCSDSMSSSSRTASRMAPGSTPSSSQTTQYLYRNEALKQLAELRDEIDYQLSLPSDQNETDVAREALAALGVRLLRLDSATRTWEASLRARDGVHTGSGSRGGKNSER